MTRHYSGYGSEFKIITYDLLELSNFLKSPFQEDNHLSSKLLRWAALTKQQRLGLKQPVLRLELARSYSVL